MSQEDASLYNQKITQAVRDTLGSAEQLFTPEVPPGQPIAAIFAEVEPLFDRAPEATPIIEQSIDTMTDSVRGFLKDASRFFGEASLTLENASKITRL